jgi:hypothetical protein
MLKLLGAAALVTAVCAPATARPLNYLRQSSVDISASGCLQQCSSESIDRAIHFTHGDIGGFIYYDPSPTLTTLDHTSQYSGLDASGNYSTMTFAATGRADVGEGSLKSSINASIINPFYSEENAPFITEFLDDQGSYIGQELTDGGVPSFFAASSLAAMRDQLAVAGAANLSQVRFTLSLDGTISHNSLDGVEIQAQLLEDRFDRYDTLNVFSSAGDFDQTFTSGVYDVINGKVDFGFTVASSIFYNLMQMGDNTLDRSASVDFGNTLKIVAVSGFDSVGQAVTITSATGSNGFAYQVASAGAVPEPTTWALMLAGFGMVGHALRRRPRVSYAR